MGENRKKTEFRVFRTVFLGLMVALSVTLIFLVHFPIFPIVSFLEYDPGDVTIILATAFFGPWAGLLVTAAACLIQGVTVSAQSGIYGILMHILATGTYVLIFGLLTRKSPSLKRLIIAACCASLGMTVMMFFGNMVVTPLFTGWPVSAVMELMPFILAFNLVKAGINSVGALFLIGVCRKLFRNNLGA